MDRVWSWDFIYRVKRPQYAGDNVPEVEEANNADLGRIDRWYEGNEMRRNHEKYEAMVLGKTTEDPVFICENTNIAVEEQIDLLGVT